jgi:ADP-heptose:LPS heptosyltransferase
VFGRIPGVEKCIAEYDIPNVFHDFWIPGFSCSWLFGHTYETVPNEPYISCNPKSYEIWKGFLDTSKEDKRPKIGIRWGGNPQFEHQQFRIFPPKKLINIYKNSQFKFLSLQRDTDLVELPEEITDLQHILISWEDTAACIANLDLVITSCTSIAHLSAAMGKPTWVIVPMLPYHIWTYGGDHSPWYLNTTKVFRQTKFGEWDDTFEKLENELLEYFN